nr:MAG TPA: hypothetical protein [Caudoviricetes sp.]
MGQNSVVKKVRLLLSSFKRENINLSLTEYIRKK